MAWDMFLKNVNSNLLSKISIRTRLTVFYSIAAFILLTVITVFLYWETINILYKADYQFLSDEVESIQYAMQNKQANLAALKKEAIASPTQAIDSIYRYYVRIFDDHSQILIETPEISHILPPDTNISLTHKHVSKKTFRWYSYNNNNYLLVQAPIKYSKGKYGAVQIVLDISYQHTVMSDRKYLMVALLVSALSSLFLGFFITHRGMKSLYLLTGTVKKITATSLHQRIDPKSLPKELNPLGIAFNQMLDRIESSFVRLKQFSSDLAHELRIPINNLIGETEIVLSRNHTINEYQQVLMSNLEEYQRVSQLIENMLFLSRAEHPQLEIQKTLLNVYDEIAVVSEYYQAMADEKNISITYEGKAHLHGNSIMFRRMISNLLSNSLKYTHENGWIKILISFHHSLVKITLSDNGIGIPPEHLPKVFDRFYRVDSARSQLSGGTGLGLPIVKSIVDLHQGHITITSTPDHGTTVTLNFPK